jgi:hypothetical protein
VFGFDLYISLYTINIIVFCWGPYKFLWTLKTIFTEAFRLRWILISKVHKNSYWPPECKFLFGRGLVEVGFSVYSIYMNCLWMRGYEQIEIEGLPSMSRLFHGKPVDSIVHTINTCMSHVYRWRQLSLTTRRWHKVDHCLLVMAMCAINNLNNC